MVNFPTSYEAQKRKIRTRLKPTPRAPRQRPTGASYPAFCFPAPASLGREQHAAQASLGKATDVTRFWLGQKRGAAVAQLSQSPQKPGSVIRTGATPAPIAWKARPNRKPDKFYPYHARKDVASWAKQGGEQTQSFNIWSLKVAWASSRICLSVTSHCSQRASRIIVSRMGPLRSRNASA